MWAPTRPDLPRLADAIFDLEEKGFKDIFGMNARNAGGTFAMASFLVPAQTDALPRGLVKQWELVVRHLTLGTQLRRRPHTPGALLRLDGKILDADDRAWSERDVLRDLVRRLMRARTAARDREDPLQSRQGGRWLFVDRFDSDGRHVIVAYTHRVAPERLSARERQIAELLAGGQSHKQIASRLDLSLGTVGSYAHRIFAKLGVGGRVELAHALARSPHGE